MGEQRNGSHKLKTMPCPEAEVFHHEYTQAELRAGGLATDMALAMTLT
jgi:hypothetical protein